MSSADS